MAYAKTVDTRTHTLGDLHMVTGTFTDGGTDVYYGDHLSSVLAAGAHLTSLTGPGILVNAGDIAATSTSLTVDTVDARVHLSAGQTLYSATGVRLGVIASIGSATAITLAAPGLSAAVVNNDEYYVLGANKGSLTLVSTSVDVSIDETNKYVQFETGNRSATSTTSAEDGRWWILGKR